MLPGKRRKVVLFEKVVDAFAEEFGDDADVVAVVEPLEQLDASPVRGEKAPRMRCEMSPAASTGANSSDILLVCGVVLLEGLEDADLDLGRVAVFGDRSDDLDGDEGAVLVVVCFDNLAERTLAQESDDAVWAEDELWT